MCNDLVKSLKLEQRSFLQYLAVLIKETEAQSDKDESQSSLAELLFVWLEYRPQIISTKNVTP